MKKNKLTPWLLLLPFLAVTALVVISVWNVLVQSLGLIPAFGLTEPTTEYYRQVLTSDTFLSSLVVSLKIAFWSAILATVLGVLVCAALTGCGRKGMVHVVRMPLLVPHTVVALFAITICSQTGLMARGAAALGFIGDSTEFPQLLFTDSYVGVILAYLWKEIPFVAYFVLALMSGISGTLGEAAENLGASPLKSFFCITLPLSLPAISKAFLIIFIFAFGGYELPLILGATVPKALPVQAYLSYMDPNLLNRPYAMAMNGVILLLSMTMAAVYGLLTHRLCKDLGGAA